MVVTDATGKLYLLQGIHTSSEDTMYVHPVCILCFRPDWFLGWLCDDVGVWHPLTPSLPSALPRGAWSLRSGSRPRETRYICSVYVMYIQPCYKIIVMA